MDRSNNFGKQNQHLIGSSLSYFVDPLLFLLFSRALPFLSLAKETRIKMIIKNGFLVFLFDFIGVVLYLKMNTKKGETRSVAEATIPSSAVIGRPGDAIASFACARCPYSSSIRLICIRFRCERPSKRPLERQNKKQLETTRTTVECCNCDWNRREQQNSVTLPSFASEKTSASSLGPKGDDEAPSPWQRAGRVRGAPHLHTRFRVRLHN